MREDGGQIHPRTQYHAPAAMAQTYQPAPSITQEAGMTYRQWLVGRMMERYYDSVINSSVGRAALNSVDESGIRDEARRHAVLAHIIADEVIREDKFPSAQRLASALST
jgi:hypothetical protein